MVGIVIVSHSEKIAEGTVELCAQMSQGLVNIVPAGGTADHRIGTDATKIERAILQADSGDGVLVFVDLGSAMMSTDVALELLDADIRKRVIVADAPLVEGSVVATVEASMGSDLETVRNTAEESREMSKTD
ncbi:MAG: dihydroxyacetone kinase phosphoryl donor subunit DhaM [Bacillota bacterium]